MRLSAPLACAWQYALQGALMLALSPGISAQQEAFGSCACSLVKWPHRKTNARSVANDSRQLRATVGRLPMVTHPGALADISCVLASAPGKI